MIDRLRSVVNVERLRSLKWLLAQNLEKEKIVDDQRDQEWAQDPMWTPEERVLTLLDNNGGRMWQQSIGSDTGYSEAQVSRLLCKLEANGIVDRHWRGGQKLVVLDRDAAEAVQAEQVSPSEVHR